MIDLVLQCGVLHMAKSKVRYDTETKHLPNVAQSALCKKCCQKKRLVLTNKVDIIYELIQDKCKHKNVDKDSLEGYSEGSSVFGVTDIKCPDCDKRWKKTIIKFGREENE